MAIVATASPIFQQAMRVITAITNAYPVSITTSFAHNYSTGLIVRINVPAGFGMQQLNQLYGPIIVTSTTTFTMDIDTSSFDTFNYQINIGSTNGSGAASGTISGTSQLVGLGQFFNIGTQLFQVVSSDGALVPSGTGSGTGTMDMVTGAYTFTGAAVSTPILWSPISYPESYQYTTVVPMGEVNSSLAQATRNVLPRS